MRFLIFGCIWQSLVALQHSVQNGPLVQKFVPRRRVGIFRKERTHPPHWTLNSCFGVFCTIWMHLVPFGYLTKVGAKRAEVVQNFVP